MRAELSRRIAAVEARRKPPVRYPHIVRVNVGETTAEAIREHIAAHGRPPRGSGLCVVPKKVSTPTEREEFTRRFFEQQTRLVANARNRRAITQEAPQPSLFETLLNRRVKKLRKDF